VEKGGGAEMQKSNAKLPGDSIKKENRGNSKPAKVGGGGGKCMQWGNHRLQRGAKRRPDSSKRKD